MSVVGTCNNCQTLSSNSFYTSGSTTNIFVDVVNQNGQSISDCVQVTNEVIRTFPILEEFDDCGCPVNECDRGSLRINISRGVNTPEIDCGFKGFTLDETGLVLFELYNDTTTFFMNSQCCTSLGYTPELKNSIYVCRWGIKRELCDDYQPFRVVDGYQNFYGPNGSIVDAVPSAECCPSTFIPELLGDGTYRCMEEIKTPPEEEISCSGLTPSDVNQLNGKVLFIMPDFSETYYVPAVECCTNFGFESIADSGGISCTVSCESYSGITESQFGLITFVRNDNSTFTEVPFPDCCPSGAIANPVQNANGLTYYTCRNSVLEPVTGNTLYQAYIYKNPSNATGENRCANATGGMYWINSTVWENATQIYTNSAGTTLAGAGWYIPAIVNIDGGHSRRWSGTSFGASIICAVDEGPGNI